jgi:hypothetical protein
MSRILALTALALASSLAVAACAGPARETSTASPGREDPLSRLERQCEARGGVLVPAGRFSGEPALDNICSLRGASIPPP